MNNNYSLETLAIHAGQNKEQDGSLSRAVPIYQTTSFMFKNSKHAVDLFSLKEMGNIYSRIMNPTNDVLEKRLTALEGGIGALAVSSGQAAEAMTIFTLAKSGDHIVASSSLYGGTISFFGSVLPRHNIKTTFVDPKKTDNFEKAIKDNTKCIYAETIGNPEGNILDIEKVSKIAHKHNIPLIIDNTFATPVICRPFDYGADIVIHSCTKWIGGHGTSIGGIIIDSGNFDWEKSGKFSDFCNPDPSYHDLNFWQTFKEQTFIIRARVINLRDMGPCLSPMNAFLFLQGIETLPLRMERHVQNAKKLAEYLSSNSKINWIKYAGLKQSPYHDLASKYTPMGPGSVITFGIKGGKQSALNFIENVKLASHLANVGDAKTLVIHPAGTTHQQLTDKQLKEAGISDDMIRVSVGIENIKDIIDDFNQALNNI